MDLNNDELLFSIDILYTIIFKCNKKIKIEENFLNDEMKGNIRNILKPYIDETLSYASLKIGLPRLELPPFRLKK